MGLFEVLMVAVGLSMDAFAVAVCKGMCFSKITAKNTLIVGAYFGFFQALMPVIGYFLGTAFSSYIERYDHIIAFILLAFIGGKMIYEALKDELQENKNGSLKIGEMLLLSIATSIDALAVGVTLAFLKDGSANIFVSALIIGVVTFALSSLGVIIGKKFGERLQRKAELFGGLILIIIGAKILIEHSFFS
jgi:hypothetical protein